MDTKKEKAYAGILELDRVILPLWFKSLEKAGVSMSQSEIIILLGVEEASISYLSKELGITSSAVTQTVETLEKKKLVKRTHKSSDKRIVSVMLLEKGEECLGLLLHERYRLINTLLDDFTDAELSQLITLHKKMRDSVKE